MKLTQSDETILMIISNILLLGTIMIFVFIREAQFLFWTMWIIAMSIIVICLKSEIMNKSNKNEEI
jgi:hypothetical protein